MVNRNLKKERFRSAFQRLAGHEDEIKKIELQKHLDQFHITDGLFEKMWNSINSVNECKDSLKQKKDEDDSVITYNEFEMFLQKLEDRDICWKMTRSVIFFGALINVIARICAIVVFFLEPPKTNYILKCVVSICLLNGALVIMYLVIKIKKQSFRMNAQTLSMITNVFPQQNTHFLSLTNKNNSHLKINTEPYLNKDVSQRIIFDETLISGNIELDDKKLEINSYIQNKRETSDDEVSEISVSSIPNIDYDDDGLQNCEEEKKDHLSLKLDHFTTTPTSKHYSHSPPSEIASHQRRKRSDNISLSMIVMPSMAKKTSPSFSANLSRQSSMNQTAPFRNQRRNSKISEGKNSNNSQRIRHAEKDPLFTIQPLNDLHQKEKQQKKIILVQPGRLGVYMADVKSGIITKFVDDLQESFKRAEIFPGWIITQIDNRPYNEIILRKKVRGQYSYTLEVSPPQKSKCPRSYTNNGFSRKNNDRQINNNRHDNKLVSNMSYRERKSYRETRGFDNVNKQGGKYDNENYYGGKNYYDKKFSSADIYE